VEKREIPGYYLKITDYAEELLGCVQSGSSDRATCTRLARARAPDAGQLDRQKRGRAIRLHARHRAADGTLIGDGKHVRVHHPCRHHHGRHLLRRGARASAWPRTPREQRRRWHAFIEDCKAGGTTEAELAAQGKKGMPTGLQVTHPLNGAPDRRLGGQLRADGLRRWRGDGRAGARRARFRVRQKVRLAHR